VKTLQKKYTLVLFVFLLVQNSIAQDKISYTTYFFNDSGDNNVITTSFSLAKKIIKGTAVLLDIELDKVSLPPVDGSSGATRPSRKKDETFEKNRGQVIVGVEQSLGAITFAVNAYRSQEIDYLSNALIVTMSQDLFQNNTTLTARAQYNDDKVGELLEDGQLIKKDKAVITAALNLSQVLSKSSVLNLSYDFMKMTGFLSDPYRRVVVFDQANVFQTVKENHPDLRLRHAVTGKISQFLTTVNASVIASYRYYFDDWQVKSHTAEVRFNKYVFDDFITGFNYRYYAQGGASFYTKKYSLSASPGQQLRTADYKLNPFQSNSYGLNLRYLLRGLAKGNPGWEFLEKSSFEVMYLRYVNDLDFSANIVQASLNFAI
jgi:Protein of unknown function (DUF3570)